MLNFDRNQHGWLRSATVTACDIFTESVIKLFNINMRKECGSIFYFNIIQRCILTSTLGLPIIFTQPLFILFYFFPKDLLFIFVVNSLKKKLIYVRLELRNKLDIDSLTSRFKREIKYLAFIHSPRSNTDISTSV